MNKLFLFFVGVLVALNCMGQNVTSVEETKKTAESTETERKAAITIGILNGGGGIVGADLEFMLSDRFSLQFGAGFVSFGAGINFHLKPGIRSSMINLGYWHQGHAETFTQSVFGPSFVFRARKLFTAQLGYGFVLEKGPAWPDDIVSSSTMLLYSIGIYLPI